MTAVILKCWRPDSVGLWGVALPPQRDPDDPHNEFTGGSGFL